MGRGEEEGNIAVGLIHSQRYLDRLEIDTLSNARVIDTETGFWCHGFGEGVEDVYICYLN